jgi:hypothetical protein
VWTGCEVDEERRGGAGEDDEVGVSARTGRARSTRRSAAARARMTRSGRRGRPERPGRRRMTSRWWLRGSRGDDNEARGGAAENDDVGAAGAGRRRGRGTGAAAHTGESRPGTHARRRTAVAAHECRKGDVVLKFCELWERKKGNL